MNSRLKNLLLGLVFICFGIGIGIGIGAGIWSDGDELIDQGPETRLILDHLLNSMTKNLVT